jgi:hypothetical protein
MRDFPHGGNPLHNGTLYLVLTTGDPEEPEYTGLNRLAIELAKEWSFWATTILGEAEEP